MWEKWKRSSNDDSSSTRRLMPLAEKHLRSRKPERELIMSIGDRSKEALRKHRASVENLKYIGLVSTHLGTGFFLGDDADEAEAAFCSEVEVTETTLKKSTKLTLWDQIVFL